MGLKIVKNSKKFIRLSDVPVWLAETLGKQASLATVYNWTHRGKRNYYGKLKRLRTKEFHGVRHTTESWLMNFLKDVLC